MRSVGGDELNVCVALAKLGRKTKWVSVLPCGPMGKVVLDSADQVDVSHVIMEKDAGIRNYQDLLYSNRSLLNCRCWYFHCLTRNENSSLSAKEQCFCHS
jgi:hypothetical protein